MVPCGANYLRREFCRADHTDQQMFIDELLDAKEMWDFIDWIRTEILNIKDWKDFSECTENAMKKKGFTFF